MNKNLSKIIISLSLLSTTVVFADLASDMAEQKKAIQVVMDNFQKKIKENPKMSREDQNALMLKMMDESDIGKKILETQKDQMPKMIKILKADSKCLSKAETKKEAKICEKSSIELAKKLGLNQNPPSNKDYEWDKNISSRVIPAMNKQIEALEKSLECTEKAKVISDISKCMKKLINKEKKK